MKRIQVGGHRKNSKIKLYAFVDSEDFEKVSKYRWIIQKNGWGQIYAYSHKEKTLMHRLIMECPEMIDHANGNGLDNRKSNLRICDKRLNMANSKKRSDAKTSTYKGVSKHTDHHREKPWVVRVSRKRIGTYKTEEEAARAYNKAARSAFGQYAKLNTIST